MKVIALVCILDAENERIITASEEGESVVYELADHASISDAMDALEAGGMVRLDTGGVLSWPVMAPPETAE